MNFTEKKYISGSWVGDTFKVGDKVRRKDSGKEYYVIPRDQTHRASYTGQYQTAVRPIEKDTDTLGWMVVTKNLELVTSKEEETNDTTIRSNSRR